MNRFGTLSATSLLFAAMAFTSAAQAMEIIQFDKMADQDQATYVGLLVEGAQKVLIDERKNEPAAQVLKLFRDIPPGDTISLGMEEFETNLAQARLIDAEMHSKNNNAVRLEAEHAMIMTLQKNGIVLPKSFMTVGNNFKSKFPPQKN
jgi:hypothetical protein